MSTNIAPSGLPTTGYIRQSQLVPHIVPISPATLWRWVKNGQFPKPHKLGSNTTAWPAASIRAWLDAQGSTK